MADVQQSTNNRSLQETSATSNFTPFLTSLLLPVVTETNTKIMNDNKTNHPLLCDIETGMCETPNTETKQQTIKNTAIQGEKIKVVYFTDPICSSCWGIEPQLRKLKLEYGPAIEIDYRMGGLLPDWNYNSGGISKPADVAQHWDEVSVHYDMPIDGDVWLEDPLSSSYPSSIAFKAAQIQDKNKNEDKAIAFLRVVREMVFLEKKNIAKWEHLEAAAKQVGLDPIQLKADYEGKARALFEEDLQLARTYGVRGFPTLFFERTGTRELVYGTKPYPFYETALLTLYPQVQKMHYTKTWDYLFGVYPTLTAKEFAELSGMPRVESEQHLIQLTADGILLQTATKNGSMWTLKRS